LYTLASGDPASSLVVTCENFAADAKEKSDTYHGEIADSECNMDDDNLEIHDQTFCGSTGPYMVYTLTVVDGGNPLSCTDSFSCDSATRSSESVSCTISYGTPGPGPPSYSYSVPPPSGGRRGVSSAAAAGGSVFAIFITILVLYYLWRLGCCSGCGKQTDERIASQSHNIEMASPAPQYEHRVVPPHIIPGQTPHENNVTFGYPPSGDGSSRFCANCGSPMANGAFCANCGTKLQKFFRGS